MKINFAEQVAHAREASDSGMEMQAEMARLLGVAYIDAPACVPRRRTKPRAGTGCTLPATCRWLRGDSHGRH